MNPWKTLSSAVQYDNPWIRVTEHQVLRPFGAPGIYGTVHFKNLATGVVVLDEELNTWLVGQWRYPLGRYSWEIPEGGGPLDVDPLETARRELIEETGIVARDWQKVQEVDLSNSVTDERGVIFLARGLSYTEPRPDDTEALDLRKLPLEQALRMVAAGEITGAMSVIGLLRVQQVLSGHGAG
jgi:8-oxo-dGTP pyrophosphatase MutT (NUDIX family)